MAFQEHLLLFQVRQVQVRLVTSFEEQAGQLYPWAALFLDLELHLQLLFCLTEKEELLRSL